MNRRELLDEAAERAAKLPGATVTPIDIPIDSRPLLLILKTECCSYQDQDHMLDFMERWKEFSDKNNLPPLVVLKPWMTLECVLDPRTVQPDSPMVVES